MTSNPVTTQPEQTEHIGGERRDDRRYAMQFEMRWKLIRRRRIMESGTGHTLDLSSGGLLIETGGPLPVGLDVELAVAWPAKLHNIAPMQLIVWGRVVRSTPHGGGIQMTQHEFRTTGVQAPPRGMMANVAHASNLYGSHTSNLTGIGKSN